MFAVCLGECDKERMTTKIFVFFFHLAFEAINWTQCQDQKSSSCVVESSTFPLVSDQQPAIASWINHTQLARSKTFIKGITMNIYVLSHPRPPPLYRVRTRCPYLSMNVFNIPCWLFDTYLVNVVTRIFIWWKLFLFAIHFFNGTQETIAFVSCDYARCVILSKSFFNFRSFCCCRCRCKTIETVLFAWDRNVQRQWNGNGIS